jgi:urease accessory protein
MQVTLSNPVNTQGSTKVFKTRTGQRAFNRKPLIPLGDSTTNQNLDVRVHSNGTIFLLPDPVTCFRSASYHQVQRFYLARNASAIILDWVTSGRQALGEQWAFAQYYSVNEIFVEGKRVARDATLLDGSGSDAKSLPIRTLTERLAPYLCYATVFLQGPTVQDVVTGLKAQYDNITVFKRSYPEDLIWSLSSFSETGAVIRIAGKETEGVKQWLRAALVGVEKIVGVDIYRRAFA